MRLLIFLASQVARATMLLWLALLGACAPVYMPIPTALPAQIGAGETLLMALEASGPPEAAPTLTVSICDAVTGEPLRGDVYWVESEEWREPRFEEWGGQMVHSFHLSLGARAAGWLVVRREGYEMWRLRVRYEIKTSRVMELPVRLVREKLGEEL